MIQNLEENIELHRAALELLPSEHSDWSSPLRSLAVCLSNRYDKQKVDADLDEFIKLERAELELCSSGHPERGVPLQSCLCSHEARPLLLTNH